MEKNKMEVVVKGFKEILFIGLISILCLVMTGCTNKEGEIKSVEKVDNATNIKLENIDKNVNNENNKNEISQEDTNLNEHKNEKNENEQVGQTNNKENSIKQDDKTTNNIVNDESAEVVSVKATEIDLDLHFIIINGYDRNGNVIWTYETQKEASPQWSSIEYIGDYGELVYLNELGTLKMLDFQTGKVLYTNDEYKAGPSLSEIDGDGNVYLYALTREMFFVSDKYGKTIKKMELTKYDDGTGLPWPLTDPTMELIYDWDTEDYESIEIKYISTVDEEEGEKIKSTEYNKVLVINLKNYNVELKTLDTKVKYY